MKVDFDPIYPDAFASYDCDNLCVYIPVVSDIPAHHADDVHVR